MRRTDLLDAACLAGCVTFLLFFVARALQMILFDPAG
jgi:hypothetical protein